MAIGSSSRNGATVKLVVLHTGEGSRYKESMAAFFAQAGDRSSHTIADATGLLDIVPRTRAAWTLSDGNPVSVNLEMCAFAMMNREQWLSSATIDFWHPTLERTVFVDNPRQQIRYAAEWARRECEALDIPKRLLAVGDTRPGILDHWTANRTYGWGDHSDVGTGFPWDVFMGDVLGTENEELPITDGDTMFLHKVSGPGAGAVAILNGGLLSGLDSTSAASAHAANAAAGGSLFIDVTDQVWNDLVGKSQTQEKIHQFIAESTVVLRDVLAELKKLPHGTA